MKFKYLGFKADKSIAKGTLQAGSQREAKASLEAQGIEIVDLSRKRLDFGTELNIGGVKNVDRLFFVKHLGVMLKAGIPIYEALEMLQEQAKGAFKKVMAKVVKAVGSGETLAAALSKHPKAFPQLFVELIGAGELAGTLEESLKYIATFTKKELDMRKKIKSAMLYPSIVFIAVIGLIMSIGIYVLPQIVPLFSSLNSQLPKSTQILLVVADFFDAHGVKLLIAIIATGFLTPFILELKWMRPLSHWVYTRLPIAGEIVREVNLGRFFRVFATLMGAGIAIDKSLEVTKRIIKNHLFKKQIQKMHDSVVRGSNLSTALQGNERLFPAVVLHMMRVGEKSGNLEESFEYLANFYDEEVDEKLKNLSTLLEPILLIVIGILVAGVAFAIIGPIYSLSGSIR